MCRTPCCILTCKCMHKHNDDTIKTSDTVLWKNIPLPLFERVVCDRELETEQNCNILTPTLMAISISFPFSWAAQAGAWGPASLVTGFLYRIYSPARLIPNWLIGGLRAPSAVCWLSLQHLVSNWLNFLYSKLYNSSTSTFFLWTSQIALIQPIHGQGYTLLFLDRMHLLFIRVHFLFWLLGRAVCQYTTSIRKRRSSGHPYFSSSAQHVFASFSWVVWKVNCSKAIILLGCSFQDLFCFFSNRFVWGQMMQPY